MAQDHEENSTNAATVAMKFLELASEIMPMFAKFCRRPEKSLNYRALFKRNFARNAVILRSNFQAKNEIRAIHLHYYCTVLYPSIHLKVPDSSHMPALKFRQKN